MTPPTSSPSTHALSTPPQYRGVGVALAISSGILIGSSFVFKKKGLIASQKDGVVGEGVAYLKNFVWWTGMCMMIIGELMNFGAYAFTSAIIVTPLGALSVVICAVLSSIFLKERLSLFGWIGCLQCIVGSVIVALNAPQEQSVSTIKDFKRLFLAPGFLAFGSVVICIALSIIIFFAPRYGKNSMLWYISVCSMIGGLSVSCTQGLGSCIVTSIRGENQFRNWFIYFLLTFISVTLIVEIYFLNIALALFNTAMVTPTYYVMFTGCTLLTTVVLYQGLKASINEILTVVFAFLVICSGITLLQISKVEPSRLRHLDRRTTLLLQAAQEEVARPETDDPEKALLQASEEPSLDAVRGTFGVGATIVRARRRASTIGDSNSTHRSISRTSRRNSRARSRQGSSHDRDGGKAEKESAGRDLRRFQLTDAPVPPPAASSLIVPPSAFIPTRKKRRDSHGSAVAVRGSVAGGDEKASAAAGIPKSGTPEDIAKIASEGPEEELTPSTLLARQQWAESTDVEDTPMRTANGRSTPPSGSSPRPTDQHVYFSVPTRQLSNHAASPGRSVPNTTPRWVPPISQTPPLGGDSAPVSLRSSPRQHQNPAILIPARRLVNSPPRVTRSPSSPVSGSRLITQEEEVVEEDEDNVAGTVTTVESLHAIPSSGATTDTADRMSLISSDCSANPVLASREHLRW